MSSPLALHEVQFSWAESGQTLYQNLSLPLLSGQVYGLLGRNGAGKTTLLRLLCGGLSPKHGEVRLQAEAGAPTLLVSKRQPESLREIVFVPETIALPPLKVEAFGKLFGAFYPRFSQERFLQNLAALEVPRQGDLRKLSFGQGRKAHIAFALATGALAIFLDEPSNGLDVAAQMQLRRLIREELSPRQLLLVSTHHVREFEDVMTRVIVLEKGQILAQRSLADLRAQTDFKSLEDWYAETIQLDFAPGA